MWEFEPVVLRDTDITLFTSSHMSSPPVKGYCGKITLGPTGEVIGR